MMSRWAAAVLICAIALGTQPPIAAVDETDRLVTLGRVWAYVKYSHPQVALGNVDWDPAVLKAIPKVKTAADDGAFARLVNDMLSTLDDPRTRVRASNEPPPVSTPPRAPLLSRSGDLLVLRMTAATNANDVRRELARDASLASIRRVVVDLRDSRSEVASDASRHLLVSERVHLAAMRSATVTAFERFQTLGAADSIEPNSGTPPRRSVFVVDRRSPVPWILYSLRASGSAQVVCVGEPPDGAESVESLALPGGHVAQIRVMDLTIAGKRVVFGCDQKLAAEAKPSQVDEAANELLQRPTMPVVAAADPPPMVPVEEGYSAPRYPDEPHRVLAVYRFWAAVNYSFAYKHLMDRPWDDALAEFIPRASGAPNELEYVKTMAAMAARLQDSHVIVQESAVFRDWLSGEPQAAQVRFVEGKPIVTRLLEVVANGPALGDEIVAVNDQSVGARIERIIPYISFATPQARDRLLGAVIVAGQRGTKSTLRVRREGQIIEVTTSEHDPRYRGRPARDGDVVRVLEGNIGYVDLDRLANVDVDAAFERLRDTRGIIFDMRGYPTAVLGGYVAAHLNTRGNPATAMISTPVVSGGWVSTKWQMLQTLSMLSQGSPSRVYTNPTVMLIDARAQSSAEAMGMFLRAANGTRFVGTSTTGSNGQTVSIPMPGGFTVRFTGNEVRHPDGTQLQRVGLKPDIEVAPTIAGITAGRDEVLERAVEYLTTGK